MRLHLAAGIGGARRVHLRIFWLADECRGLLARLGLEFHVALRDRNAACYTKRGETAADLLAVLGAHSARLAWEEQLVFGEVRGRANRLANCDQANAGRAATAALRQTETIRLLMRDDAWTVAPQALRRRPRCGFGTPT